MVREDNERPVLNEGRRRDNDAVLLRVFEAAAAYTGDDFFKAVCRALCASAGVSLAFVSELLLDVEQARLIAGCADAQPIEPVEYALAGTPCGETVTSDSCVHERGVRSAFPTDRWLELVRAESYVGVLLRSESGDPLGILGIIDHERLQDPASLLALLERVAPRVASEIERRQRSFARRRSETRLRLLADYSKDILFYYRIQPSPSFLYVSPAIEEIFGLPPEAVLANPDTAFQMIQDGDRQQVLQAVVSGSEEPILAQLTRPDGETRWIEYRNFPFWDSEERLIAVGGTIRDITRRVAAEEALRLSEHYRGALLEAIPDTLFRLNTEGVVLDFVVGEAVAEVARASTGVIGRSIYDLLATVLPGSARHLIHSAAQSGKLQRLEFEVPSESRFYEARCVPFSNDEVLLILRDFTAMKWHEAEEERRRLRDELDVKVEQRIRTIPYGLTYRELAVLHLVAEGSADKQIAEALGISIYTVNKHVGNILGKMNAASRTEAGVRALREGLLG